MVYVSISVYDDAAVAAGAVESAYRHVPDAAIALVDGRYQTWPAANDNTEPIEDMLSLADAYGAEYHRDGPYPREVNKHRHRVDLAPDGDLVLFLDADERVAAFDLDALDPAACYDVRIFNPVVYGPRLVYWPRVFDPANIEEVIRWDKYVVGARRERTDAVSIVHRHDLRDGVYRRQKYDRFREEGRLGIYEQLDRAEDYFNDTLDPAVELEGCPVCGEVAAIASVPTPVSDRGMTAVVACLACDEGSVVPYEVGEWRYLPDDLDAGFEEDPGRLQVELTDAGCPFITGTSPMTMEDMRPAVELWAEETFGQGPAGVFAEPEVPDAD